jgi:hypothetical protein
MVLRPELTNLWDLRRRVLKFLIWAQKGSVANIIANSNNVRAFMTFPGIDVDAVKVEGKGTKVSADKPGSGEGDLELCIPRPGKTRQKSMDVRNSSDPTIIYSTVIEELI